MENQQSEYVRARATFTDTMKSGDDQITLILGEADVQQLVERLQNTSAVDGVRVQIFLKPYNGKTLGSIRVTEGTPRKGAASAAPAKAAFAPKKFGFQPKK